MRHVLVSLLFACAAASLAGSPLKAQQAQPGPDLAATEFSAELERWRQIQDIEQKIALGEQLLANEAKLASWPLDSSRERVRADIAFELGTTYLARAQGVHAENLERAIACFDIALKGWTREATPVE